MVACQGARYRAPVEDRYARSAPASNSIYRVRPGETLYSIAFRYGLDYRKVASANSISAPYVIYVGQTLKLTEAAPSGSAPISASSPPVAAVLKSSSARTVPKTKSVPNQPKRSVSSAPAIPPPSKRVPSGVPASQVTKATSKPVRKAPPSKVVSRWRWPSNGKVLRRYSSSVHKGIDIGGRLGDPVYAVAPGEVVYAGTGIVGLGELLIVKHNEVYLSAYGHNTRLLVGEGDRVKLGQRIADKGSSGTDTVKLHFEIRKEGKPIDPLRLLPRR